MSGGEPMLYAKAASSLLQMAKRAGIGTAIETCGYFDSALLTEVLPWTDSFLWDIKDTDAKRHLANTNVPIDRILENLAGPTPAALPRACAAFSSAASIWIRRI